MPFLIIFYLLLFGVLLSLLHTARAVQRGRRFGATVDEMRTAHREKVLLGISAAVAAVWILLILISLMVTDFFYEWVVLVPFAYLCTWVLLHYLDGRGDEDDA